MRLILLTSILIFASLFARKGFATSPGDNPGVSTLSLKAVNSETSSSEEEEMVILAPSSVRNKADLLSVKKNSAKVVDGSSAEQMSRQGDGNAASALKRVTGVTIKDGKYVIIRGLGERYSLARYNSFFLPPLESTKKQVALDLFPTGALSAIQVDKTYTADLPAEFGGGLVTLRSRDYLGFEGFRLQVGFHLNGDSSALSYHKGSRDLIGEDDGTRALPAKIKGILDAGRPLIRKSPGVDNGFTDAELEEFGRLLPKNYNTFNDATTPLPRLQLLASHQHALFGAKYFHTETFSYAQDLGSYEAAQRTYNLSSGTQLELAEDNKIERYTTETNISLTHSSLFKWGPIHDLKIDLLALRNSSDEVYRKDNEGPGVNDHLRKITRLEFSQRDLLGTQIHSTFKPENYEIKNGLAFTTVTKQTPDQRDYTYRQKQSTDPLELDPEVSGNSRSWGSLNEQDLELQTEISRSFAILQLQNKWSLGFQNLQRQRESKTYRLQYVKDYLAGQTPDLTLPPDQIFEKSQDWILVNQTQAADRYLGQQQKQTLYTEIKTEWNEQVQTLAGYHLEKNDLRVDNYAFGSATPDSGSRLESLDGLPALTLTWTPVAQHKVYLSTSETLAYPDFRELSPVRYFDDESGYEARGNSRLQSTLIHSQDIRWEYYPHEEEVLSLGVFQKEFTRPIEDVFIPVAGSLLKAPQNAKKGHLLGLEAEIRLAARRWMRELRFISISFNGALMQSSVELDPAQSGNLTNDTRPMQGQSPWLFNSEVFYQRDPKGWLLSLSYNVNGPRIFAVGTDQRPDVYEQPFHQVDFNASWAPDNNGKWGFKWRNILDAQRTLKMDDKTTLEYKQGADIYVSYTATI
ncbi:MAG: hypothetical protein OM95_11855 [Bdellovibrio sp. ArHS]|uniref:TonB-dependent receptor plug domain-containing protein n=1 Tax=Bdellovibrio sp. ArHS TaxID=1569284 RepID=UPI0005839C64|nr:TonB-dependent receptor plug domain-containing protein [Bdellovibrio sp. ArHS]KHD87951.1 MAG: hypothetical protein OM95_11855 [Bdellovibrio sp. ArHS]